MTGGYGFNPEDRSFTFRNGRAVTVRQISYHLEDAVAQRLRGEFPPPAPPRQPATLPDGSTVEVENTADPDYEASLQAWQRQYNMRLNERLYTLFLRRGVEFDVDVAAVQQLRADAEDLYLDLSPDDRHVHLFQLCVGSPDEEVDLIKAIRGLSYPTEEAIAKAIASFRG